MKKPDGIPILNVRGLLSINQIRDKNEITPDLMAICQAIGDATKQIGFFVAAPDHGVQGLEEIEALGIRFFAQPEQEKQNFSMYNNPTFRGYTSLFSETTQGKSDYKACFDSGTQHPENQGKETFLGYTDYPDAEFERICTTYHNEMRAFGSAVMRAFAVYLDLPLDSMTTPEHTPMENHLFRMLCYPPAPNAQEKIQGVGSHTDYGALAMLFATGGGLEVYNKSNEWVQVPFIPYSIVVNIGDLIETWTNGLFRATWHRVIHQNDFWRYSFPFFYEPSFDATIEPLLPPSNPEKTYGPLNYEQHVCKGTSKSFSKHTFSKKWLQ